MRDFTFSLFLERSQKVLISDAISSGKGCVVIVGFSAQSEALSAQRNG